MQHIALKYNEIPYLLHIIPLAYARGIIYAVAFVTLRFLNKIIRKLAKLKIAQIETNKPTLTAPAIAVDINKLIYRLSIK